IVLSKSDKALINSRLSMIKFPQKMLRTMPQIGGRSLKAIEYELILFYGWICFIGIVEPKRCRNFQQLAFILSSLSARYISKRLDIRLVEKEITNFLTLFDEIYSKSEEFMWKI